ncbi:MAG TPA: glycosyltransferase family 9 protein, partial [Ktedonobacterales bacterium]|nr:glycosyltransferase family 9 protein [Ktedonobacterales bacterium]
KASARRWMPERFAEVADTLIERFDARIVLVGSASDRGHACAVRAAMRHAPLDLTGKTSLGGLAALFERMRLFIGNDSGPAHLAEAVGTPSVTVFGPGDPRCWAPLDQRSHRVVVEPVGCNPCAYADCPIDHRCLRRITPVQVLAHAHELLAKGVRACGA